MAAALSRLMGTTRGRIALLVGTVSVVWLVTSAVNHVAFHAYSSFGECLWWGFVHLIDPSALQDDEGSGRRVVGVVQVVVGLTLLVGILFTVVAEIVGASLQRLGSLNPTIRDRGHAVLVGGTELLPSIVEDLAGEAGASAPVRSIVALLAPAQRERRQELLADLRRRAGPLRVQIVVAEAGSDEGFATAGARRAAVVVVMPTGTGFVLSTEADFDVIRIGVALRDHLDASDEAERPRVALFFRRGTNTDAAWPLFPDDWDALVGDRGLAAGLRVALTRPQLAGLLLGVRGAPGSRLALLPAGGLAGVPFAQAAGRVGDAVALGLVRRDEEGEAHALLVPGPDEEVRARDRLVVLGATVPPETEGPASAPVPVVVPAGGRGQPSGPMRLLVLGWSVPVSALPQEFAEHAEDDVEITIMPGLQATPPLLPDELPANVRVHLCDGDPSVPTTLHRVVRETRPTAVLVASTPVDRDLGAGDARARLVSLHVRRLEETATVPMALALFFPVAATRLAGARNPRTQVFSSAELAARTIALVVRDPDAAAVTEALLGDRELRPDTVDFDPPDRLPVPFAAVYQGLLRSGAVPLAVAREDGRAHVAPGHDDEVRPGDALLVIRRRAD